DTQFHTDIDVTFTMSGEADNGLTFGANVDLDESVTGAAFATGSQGGEAIFVSFGGATLTMGDTDGAMDARMPEMALAGGSIQDDETGHVGFDDQDGHLLLGTDSGLSLDGNGDGQIARFDYTYDAFVFSFSVEQANNGADTYGFFNAIGVPAGYDADPIYGLGVGYAGEFNGISLNAGLGFQSQNDVAQTYGLAVTAGFSNGLSVGATFSKTEVDGTLESTFGLPDEDITHVGLGVGYEMNNIAVGLNWGRYEYNGAEVDGYGLAASYDLGGGLSARLGYGYSDFGGGVDVDTYSLGLAMSF
ncbi:porin, partial [Thalassococcus sp. BH17M4-6]|uniref:porin n=1 Tax=Thalassococcus sp. BH17M4-6 TaxID=3413148 RepID=UPI003BC4A881